MKSLFDDISKVILLSDMDGTLLDSKKQISQTDRDAIRRFTALGGHFSVATGRTIQSFEQYFAMIDISEPVIMYNGAAIYDYSEHRLLFTHPLPDEARDIAIELLQAMPDAGGEVLRADGTYVFRNNDYQKLHTKICNIIPNYADIPDIPEGGWLKVLFAMAPDDVDTMCALIRQRDYSNVSFVKSAEIFCEMLPLGVSKGSALAEYRKLPGYEDMTFVSVGDFDNDVEMIEQADLGACPANAQDSVKSVADLVLRHTNDEGAVAELIDHIIERCGIETA